MKSDRKSIGEIRRSIRAALDESAGTDPKISAFLLSLLNDLSAYCCNADIDFREIADSLNDSLLIADGERRFIYANPAYQRNTGIDPALVLGRTAEEIEREGNLFTGGAVLRVLRSKKPELCISMVHVGDRPVPGVVSGVPLFDEQGGIRRIIASSRPIFTYRNLHDDFTTFLKEANALGSGSPIFQVSSAASLESEHLVGSSFHFNGIRDTIIKAAPTDATVLITGESGVGKEVVADEIYRLSQRNHRPFIKVNCASIPPELLESELFGYEKGAFSGANPRGKQGLLEAANSGTVLLDEIGDMPAALQVKILRAIQSKEIMRVGGLSPIALDVRFIAATNSDLKQKITEGTFRQDLFYRLNVIPIHVPPLRRRKEDIPVLAEYFIRRCSARHGRPLVLTAEQYRLLESYSWPGNIREMENVIEYMTICSEGADENTRNYMLSAILGMEQQGGDPPSAAAPAAGEAARAGAGGSVKKLVSEYERTLLTDAVNSSKSLREAAEKLGVNVSTVSRRLKALGIDCRRRPHAEK